LGWREVRFGSWPCENVTCADAGRAVIELVDQADAVVAQLRNDANAFVQSPDEIGNAHAAPRWLTIMLSGEIRVAEPLSFSTRTPV
jgi:hypothetical protein